MPQAQIDKDMEEILSSIRQIIADDVEENTKNKSPKFSFEPALENKTVKKESKENTDEDILELTNMLPEDVYKGPLEKELEQAQTVEQQLSDAMEQAFPADSHAIEKSESLISSEIAQEVSQAVENLSHFIRQTGVQKEILNSTMEDMVRESLQPLLRTWIDQNLSKLVKEIVAEQLEKILKK
ncbi:MAG: DUF2497 domain-containing protein [Candidatus Paracaedimonas acanthamoebae]|uniref:DUF2497 domain-containing protein n=1 Tax=Candidatus Paracaedimonas acanthamoebae TaxID=244581 RepID=A0A8J7TU61_9PROT|nr:DUF2497 domain-containing protein [Candidatus Paracaedimonas acanthamoebae]